MNSFHVSYYWPHLSECQFPLIFVTLLSQQWCVIYFLLLVFVRTCFLFCFVFQLTFLWVPVFLWDTAFTFWISSLIPGGISGTCTLFTSADIKLALKPYLQVRYPKSIYLASSHSLSLSMTTTNHLLDHLNQLNHQNRKSWNHLILLHLVSILFRNYNYRVLHILTYHYYFKIWSFFCVRLLL